MASKSWCAKAAIGSPLSSEIYAGERQILHSGDTTMTALVSFRRSGTRSQTRLDSLKPKRVSSLPDRAAGVFAPGWDCAVDRTPEVDPNDDGKVVYPGVTFLAAYRLGSPFPEDTRAVCGIELRFGRLRPRTSPACSSLGVAMQQPLHYQTTS